MSSPRRRSLSARVTAEVARAEIEAQRYDDALHNRQGRAAVYPLSMFCHFSLLPFLRAHYPPPSGYRIHCKALPRSQHEMLRPG